MLSTFSSLAKARFAMNPAFRTFSAKSVDTFEGHVPPIRDDSLAGRYATVLFQQASKNKVLSKVLEDVEFLKDLHA